MQNKGRLQRVVQGLFYPAVLGSILVWFGQAVAVYFAGSFGQGQTQIPPCIALVFASVLVFYSPAAYLLIDESGNDYSIPVLIGDLFEIVGMFGVFFELGLITYKSTNYSASFGYLLLVTSVGLFHHLFRWNPPNLVLSALFCILALTGLFANAKLHEVEALNWTILMFLLACLVIYYATLGRRPNRIV